MNHALFIPFRDGRPVHAEARDVSFSVQAAGRHRAPILRAAPAAVSCAQSVGMTRRQKDALQFIGAFVGRNGFAPTYRQIAAGLGCCKSNVLRLVDGLESRGHIRRLPGRACSIEILKDAGAIVGAFDAPASTAADTDTTGGEGGRG